MRLGFSLSAIEGEGKRLQEEEFHVEGAAEVFRFKTEAQWLPLDHSRWAPLLLPPQDVAGHLFPVLQED